MSLGQTISLVAALYFIPSTAAADQGLVLDFVSDLKMFGTANVPADYNPWMNHLRDGSVSWTGPGNRLLGYMGFCGHVAWANAVTMYTGKRYDPSYLKYFTTGDKTPGIRPQTLATALNRATMKLAKVQWHLDRFEPSLAWSNLKSALRRNYFGLSNTPLPVTGLDYAPAVVLVQSSANTLHWLTVVRITEEPISNKSFVYANENGMQIRISKERFLKMWAYTEHESALATALRSAPGVGNFTVILPYTP